MGSASYSEVLELARQLPIDAQIELAEELLRAAPKQSHDSGQNFMPLQDLNDAELVALAQAVVSPERQEQLASLLQEHQLGALTSDKAAALDAMLEEIDQVALLKARALYTLHLRHLRRSPSQSTM